MEKEVATCFTSLYLIINRPPFRRCQPTSDLAIREYWRLLKKFILWTCPQQPMPFARMIWSNLLDCL